MRTVGSRVANAPRGRRLIDYPRYGRTGFKRWIPSWKLVSGLGLTGLLAAVVLFAVGYAVTEVPDPNEFVTAQTTVVYYADGTTEMGRFAEQDRVSVPIAEVPEHVTQAVIAAEDRSFYENRGISPTGIVRAFWSNLRGNSTQGGSTITQQYVKNFYLESDQTYQRKIEEAFIAIKVDQQLTKDEILESYLNTIYFGRGSYGIQTASKAYFNKNVQDLSVSEAAVIAGIIPSPSNWDPAVDPGTAEIRWNYVLDGMVEMGNLDAAERATLTFPPTVEYSRTDTFAGPTGYLLAAAREEILAKTELTDNDLDRGGLKIVTTIDQRAQDAAVAAINNPEAYPTEGRPDTLRAGLVSIDPANGAVRAMYGGADYLTKPFNSVTQGTAQAGSTFKPFTLVAALEQDISLRTTFDGRSGQEFETYVDANGDPVEVDNFGNDSYGEISLLDATENSVNTVYVALNEQVGPDATVDVAVRAGLSEDTQDLAPVTSNVLGTSSPNVLDMGQAYSTFAAQGLRTTPHIVASVGQGDQVVYEADTSGEQVFERDIMADTTFALQQVVEDGSGGFAGNNLERPAAGKTGTSQNNRSAWFTGYTAPVFTDDAPQPGTSLATAVVLYNQGPNGEQLEIPPFGGFNQITGGSVPVRIWTAFMGGALEGVEGGEFPERADVGDVPEPEVTQTPTPTTTTTTTTTPPPTTTTTPPPTTTTLPTDPETTVLCGVPPLPDCPTESPPPTTEPGGGGDETTAPG